eukprot:CAMPEP_0116126862 /NCGR_PEP_ID=MMETSP0329-20121206/6547_1 /TAXON_ID=697910 /ORGANISM="Pseudo-nitzschia arenysensis, Strain B593" /LENGTH=152 /DNA_ID=CAMNT_0003620951 /DNA_START=213 /DNA_END=671 /DNA_ORIENTATION=-
MQQPQQPKISPDLEQGRRGGGGDDVGNLRADNIKLKRLVALFACVAVVAVAGLATGITIAVMQSKRATQAENTPPQVTTVIYFNDDAPPQPTGNIVDPIPVSNSTTSNTIVITAEDLLEPEAPNGGSILDPIELDVSNELDPINDRLPEPVP